MTEDASAATAMTIRLILICSIICSDQLEPVVGAGRERLNVALGQFPRKLANWMSHQYSVSAGLNAECIAGRFICNHNAGICPPRLDTPCRLGINWARTAASVLPQTMGRVGPELVTGKPTVDPGILDYVSSIAPVERRQHG